MPPSPPPSGFNFTFDPSLSEFNVSAQTYRSVHSQYNVLATGAVIFATGAEDQVLLLQRAAHDSMPLHWEVPGGAVDNEDETILHGAAREIWEETRLLVKHVVRQLGVGQVFRNRSGQEVVKFTFEAEVDGGGESMPKVTIDPNEHSGLVWVTEDEVHAHRAEVVTPGGKEAIELKITSPDQEAVILEGFRVRRGEEPRLTEDLTSEPWE